MRDINYLRESLLNTMDKLMEGKIDIEKAKAICEIGQVLVNSAKVEVDMMKATDSKGTGFMRNINVKQNGISNY
jgi:hypothetical protein